MDIPDLIPFGMTKTEAKIYLEISKLGETQIGPIIKRTGLHRGTVYNSINDLIKKGFLASKLTEKGMLYFSTGITKFKSIIEQKGKKLKEETALIERLSKELSREPTKKIEKEEILIYRGKEAFELFYKNMVDECSKNKEEFLALGAGGSTTKTFGFPFFKMLQTYQSKKKVKPRIILDKKTKNQKSHRATYRGKIRYAKYKYKVPTATRIFSNKVAFTLWEAKPPVTILIKSDELNKSYKNYFESLWKGIEGEQKIIKKRHRVNIYEFTHQAKDSLDIMGINCLTPVHESREKIIDLLKKGKRVRIILPNQKSKNFKERVKIADQFIKDINQSRVLYGLKCTIANLKDIKLKLKNKCNLEIKLFDKKPICMVIIVDNKKILHDKYKKKEGEYAYLQETLILNKEDKEFKKAKDIFEEYWKSAKPLRI